ncbi:calcium-binding and coiled-coil domain-containing protein 2 isoform X1 [Dendrobates tinctorius]|uniref:calcium-binding and coiled-coil domain-containing protein 2 isoform X1 n=1 Tax=Dendrobates tinctorius TaxID=92724 RepID=UPI003CCA3450
MDCESEKPPTSINAPMDNSFSQVIFPSVQKFYPPKTDLQCTFHMEGNFNLSPKDWIGIFKVGWKTTREYYTWISARTNVDNTVLFKGYYLPSDDDYYQFCYVNHNLEVRGASIPFQFRYNPEGEDEEILMVTPENIVEKLTEENAVLQGQVSSLEVENRTHAGKIQNLQDDLLSATEKIERLEKENMELTIHAKNHEGEIDTMNKTIQSLNIELQMQRSQEEKLLSDFKEMEKTMERIKDDKKHSENLQIDIKIAEEEKLKLESQLKLCEEKEKKSLAEREELKQALERSEAEKHHLQSEDMAKQKVLENMTCAANQCKEENVKLKAELELQTCTLEKEKSTSENLKHSLHKEVNKVLGLERTLEQKDEELRSAEETIAGLSKQVDFLEGENGNKKKQIETLQATIAKLEGEVKEMKDASKMQAEKTETEMRAQFACTEDKILSLELQLAEQQDLCRQQGEEIVVLRSTLEISNKDMQNLKGKQKKDRNTIDELHCHLLDRAPNSSMTLNRDLMFGKSYKETLASEQGASSTRGQQMKCPVCNKKFSSHQILHDHVLCHLD